MKWSEKQSWRNIAFAFILNIGEIAQFRISMYIKNCEIPDINRSLKVSLKECSVLETFANGQRES